MLAVALLVVMMMFGVGGVFSAKATNGRTGGFWTCAICRK